MGRFERRTVFTTGIILACLSIFSIFVIGHVMQIPSIQTYVMQEFQCSLVMFLISLVQIFVSYKPNIAILKALLGMEIAQFIQEIYFTWNAYYMALYIHSTRPPTSNSNSGLDSILMPINFVSHFVRLLGTGMIAKSLMVSLRLSGNSYKMELHWSIRNFIRFLGCLSLLMAILHVILDVIYTMQRQMYRTAIAYTGVSFFHLTFIAVAFTIFVRHQLISVQIPK